MKTPCFVGTLPIWFVTRWSDKLQACSLFPPARGLTSLYKSATNLALRTPKFVEKQSWSDIANTDCQVDGTWFYQQSQGWACSNPPEPAPFHELGCSNSLRFVELWTRFVNSLTQGARLNSLVFPGSKVTSSNWVAHFSARLITWALSAPTLYS